MSKVENIVLEDSQLAVAYSYYAGRAETRLDPEEYPEIEVLTVHDRYSNEISELIDSLDAMGKLEELILEQRKLDEE